MLHGLADDALVGREPETANVDRPGAFAADQRLAILLEQEDRRRLGIEIGHEAVDGVAQRFVDVQRTRELVRQLGKKHGCPVGARVQQARGIVVDHGTSRLTCAR